MQGDEEMEESFCNFLDGNVLNLDGLRTVLLHKHTLRISQTTGLPTMKKQVFCWRCEFKEPDWSPKSYFFNWLQHMRNLSRRARKAKEIQETDKKKGYEKMAEAKHRKGLEEKSKGRFSLAILFFKQAWMYAQMATQFVR